MSAEIVARLTVNAADFTTGINAAYDQVAAQAKANAAEIGGSYSSTFKQLTGTAKREFAEAFREINTLATNAASGGATNGTFDAGQMRAAANAARERAAGLQQFVAAAENASRSVAGLTKEEQLYLVASQSALRESVAEANALNLKASALERLTGEMGQTVAAQGRVRVSSGQMRSGMQQLGFQIGDVSQQLSQKGVSAMTIFSQQAPQVVQALQMMTNRTTGFLGAMAGLPGILLIAGATLALTLYNAMTKAGEGADKLGKKEKSLTERIIEQNEQLQRNIELQGQRRAADLVTANNDFALANNRVINNNATIRAKQDEIQRIITRGPETEFANTEDAIAAQRNYQNELRNARGELQELITLSKTFANEQRDQAEAVRSAQISITNQKIAGKFDKAIAETDRYQESLGKLEETYKRTNDLETYTAAATKLLEQHNKNKNAIEAETKALRDGNKEAERAAQLTAFGSPVDLRAGGVRVTGEVGNREHPTKGGTRFHAGRDIAGPAGTPVIATADGTVIHVGTAGGYGNVIVIDHGNKISSKFGHLLDKGDVAVGDKVRKGQQLGRIGSTGDSTGNHLHYEVRQGDAWKGKVLDPRRGKFAIDPEGADASAAVTGAKDAAKAAEDRAEAFARIKSDLEKEAVLLAQNARMEELRAKEMDGQADKEQKLFDLHSRYSALIADDKNLTAEDRK